MMNWIRESNLIEGVDEEKEDARCEKAYKWFLKQELNLNTIRTLHDMVMLTKLPRSERGRWRKCLVIVGGRLCPPYLQVPNMMDNWLSMYGKACREETIRIAHIAFERIHPFVDGNGRAGRIVMNWQREKAGLSPLTIRYDERGTYYGWFKDQPLPVD